MNNPIEMYFKDIEDPRKGWNVQYPLEEVMLVAMVSFLVGGEGLGKHRNGRVPVHPKRQRQLWAPLLQDRILAPCHETGRCHPGTLEHRYQSPHQDARSRLR